MPDHAISSHPAVQAQLDRLSLLSPGADILGLDRIARLCDRLGNPQLSLPPVLHVAGTNGKGSTCAYLRAAIEAAGLKAHVFTSPHLVRFNERIRVAGSLIEDEALATLLAEVLDVGGDIGASFFEVTTAAALLAFSRTPADACIVEVGLGGRLDATNIIPAPAACGVAQLGLDHQAFLGNTIEAIAAEKAGIAKPGVPVVTLHYPPGVADRVGATIEAAGGIWHVKGGSWDAAAYQGRLHYRDVQGKLDLPLPGLAGEHQATNAALAVAMLRHQSALDIPASALRAAMGWADWPARLQHLRGGDLVEMLPPGSELWIDGGHNPSAGRVIGDFLRGHVEADRPLHIVMGLLENKDAGGFLAAMGRLPARFHMVPVPGHDHHAPATLAEIARLAGFEASPAAGFEGALAMIAAQSTLKPPVVLIGGSLYLAGRALERNGTVLD
ncbi:bifunctional folylpolyglutamate synthase/dihydrofolate synthase [Rhizorhabdus dicambivorans]|uniref:tetrahydrofolate synthase n=1 Tax=Rhizorhabdus dicambivorans TaxID=1850238 RepID=A0A2A4G0X3_9SPHN|nr:folylpolyglutamate synthase/dihydrofolate synthase family protein [Rhizorhabdus dicambivorans]ATE63213.1 bifunctional folylpolyglutamate synthase/dihydrofolate synthase [Rhizorhabdus dicambivorans]PCE43427.1 bifunctional folylpolyglutamate synthase/dihydrofolate synthase [Rhizorhabdus dicambivorans]